MADEKKETKVVFERPHALLPVVTNYCPGCAHGIVTRLVAEVLDELDVEGDARAHRRRHPDACGGSRADQGTQREGG